MPIIKSAIKRVTQTKTRTRRNLIVKNRYKALVKQYIKLLEDGKKAEAGKLFPQLQKAIDMATKKNLLHARTAGRRKSTLAKMMDKDLSKKDTKATSKKKDMTKKAAPKAKKEESTTEKEK